MNSAICLLERAARLWGTRSAVQDEGGSLCYTDLRALSRRVGAGILAANASDAPVMVYLPKSIDMLLGFYGAQYAGRPYVPTAADAPAARLQKIVGNLRPSVIVTSAALAPNLEGLELSGAAVALIDDLKQTPDNGRAVDTALAGVIDADPIYIMYTSGSTGDPKGVTIPHRGVLWFAQWAEETFGWSEETVIANQAPLYFDVSVMDVYGALRCGGKLILTPEVLLRFPSKLPEFLRDNGVTHIYWVPTVMIHVANSGALDGVALPRLKSVAFAGEVMPNLQLNVWRKALPHCIFANLYGPTETDVCTCYLVDRPFSDAESLPIGRALPNMRVVLLSEDGSLTPEGETGEICVAASGVNLGYWNAPELTKKAFVDNPRTAAFSQPYYRTGDLGWWNDRGELMFVGRKDGQIKLRGNRIELGEVENAARCVEGVENVCALFDPEAQEIVLFVETAGTLPLRQFNRALRKFIPAYMLPGRLVPMERLPHNANDKIDRTALKRRLEEEHQHG